jgi:hypothetical protein
MLLCLIGTSKCFCIAGSRTSAAQPGTVLLHSQESHILLP